MFPSSLIGALRRTAIRSAAVCLSVAALLAGPSPVQAQSFFETLFGGAKKPAPAPSFSIPLQRLAPLGHAPSAISSSATRANSPNSARSSRDDDDDEPGSKAKGGNRTVCVRLCDGFYWPISNSVKASQFRKDARTCESSCGADAKLFHMPNNGEIGDAVDQSGKPYGRLPAAFLYRKKLVAGCACRPEAWSDAEVGRHQVYAFNEAQEKARKAEEEAAEEARIAAAEAAKVEAGQRLAEAKLSGKPGAKSKMGAVQAVAPVAASATSPAVATDENAAVGSATVASATRAPAQVETSAPADITPAPTASRKSRTRQSRDVASVVEVRQTNAAPSGPARAARSPQQNTRPQTTFASANPASGAGLGGLFAKKHTWPGD
jgi:Protein of unknown function (DUF2865)